MKKYFTLLLITLVFIGCKPKETVVSTKLDAKSQLGLKGNWTISTVTFPGSEYIKMTSFDIADSKCFVGSTWKFIANNNSGDMALNAASCTSFSSKFTWYINKDGNFVMKFLDENRARKIVDGYILRVANQSESNFQLIDKVNIGGKLVEVVYQFQK